MTHLKTKQINLIQILECLGKPCQNLLQLQWRTISCFTTTTYADPLMEMSPTWH